MGIAGDCEFLVPIGCAGQFATALQEDEAELVLGENHCQVTHKNGSFAFRLLDVQYPNFATPAGGKREFLGDLAVEPMIAALRSCVALCPPNLSPKVAVTYGKDGTGLEFTTPESHYQTLLPGSFAEHKASIFADSFITCLLAFKEGTVKLYHMPSNRAIVLERDELTVFTMPAITA